ncbi:MAG: GNAT family N-acetyltransferase [Candidatus Eremiobacteraeota bacterium]|nr:GNAT family N-acetyltransferase [Candidatus Eremiobacteraeota bacterium]
MSDSQALPATWLVGRKVRLRPIEPDDVPLLRRWHAGGAALAWLDRPMPLPSGAVADWAARASIDPEMPAFILQTWRGSDIGTAGLRLHGARAVLGVGIADARHWAGGYAQNAVEVLVDSAFRVMPLQRIELTAFPDDRRALECYRKAGFRKEGVLRKYAYEQGRYRDCVLMSVLHAEWVRRCKGGIR